MGRQRDKAVRREREGERKRNMQKQKSRHIDRHIEIESFASLYEINKKKQWAARPGDTACGTLVSRQREREKQRQR